MTARAGEPTLFELVASAWRRREWGARAALVAVGVIAIAFAAWLVLGRGGGSFAYDGAEAPPFSISWGELERVEPGPGELLRLEGDSESLAIRPLELEGESLAELALEARAGLEPRARIAVEGRTELAVDRGPEAYQVAYVAPAEPGAAIEIGKALFVPDPDRPGEGVRIDIAERTGDARVIEKVAQAPAGFFLNWPIQLLLEDAASVRTAEGLEEPLRSFSFG